MPFLASTSPSFQQFSMVPLLIPHTPPTVTLLRLSPALPLPLLPLTLSLTVPRKVQPVMVPRLYPQMPPA